MPSAGEVRLNHKGRILKAPERARPLLRTFSQVRRRSAFRWRTRNLPGRAIRKFRPPMAAPMPDATPAHVLTTKCDPVRSCAGNGVLPPQLARFFFRSQRSSTLECRERRSRLVARVKFSSGPEHPAHPNPQARHARARAERKKRVPVFFSFDALLRPTALFLCAHLRVEPQPAARSCCKPTTEPH